MKTLFPAILTADIETAKKHMESIGGLADCFHIDIADGKFVDNTTFAASELVQLSVLGKFEIHLMVENPALYFEDCKAAQAQRVIFHMESKDNPTDVLKAMEEYPFEKGIAINPDTPASSLVPFKDDIDAVLVMSVYPGFQGKPFEREALSKVQQIKEFAPEIEIGLDGGVSLDTLSFVVASGADYAISGSAVFGDKDPAAAFVKLKAMIH